MPTTRFTFQGASGATLSGRLDQPADGSPLAYALFSHRFTCSKDLKAVVNISRELNRHRIGIFRFDFTGLGESEGDFGETGFSSNVDDLVAAAEFMARELATPQVLIGHSFGGAAVLQAAHRIKDVRAVVTIGAPYDPSHVTHLLERGRDEIMSEGEAVVTIAGRRFRITKQFLQDLEAPRVLMPKTGTLAIRGVLDSTRSTGNCTWREISTTPNGSGSWKSLTGARYTKPLTARVATQLASVPLGERDE